MCECQLYYFLNHSFLHWPLNSISGGTCKIIISLDRSSYIRDPATVELLFEISQALNDSFDFANMKDDENQPAHLLSRFVQLVTELVDIFGSEISFSVV